jgi:hypothetical protein
VIELQTEEPQKNKAHTWRLYWFHATDLDASYPADADTLAKAGFVPVSSLAAAQEELATATAQLKSIITASMDTTALMSRLADDGLAKVAELEEQLTAAQERVAELEKMNERLHEQADGTRDGLQRLLAAEREGRERLAKCLFRVAELAHDQDDDSHEKRSARLGECAAVAFAAYSTPAPPSEGPHGGAGGGDEDGYDMTGLNGGPTHRDVRNWAEASDLPPVLKRSLVAYVDRCERAEQVPSEGPASPEGGNGSCDNCGHRLTEGEAADTDAQPYCYMCAMENHAAYRKSAEAEVEKLTQQLRAQAAELEAFREFEGALRKSAVPGSVARASFCHWFAKLDALRSQPTPTGEAKDSACVQVEMTNQGEQSCGDLGKTPGSEIPGKPPSNQEQAGAEPHVHCPRCGAHNDIDRNICRNCGTGTLSMEDVCTKPLHEPAPPPSPVAPAAEGEGCEHCGAGPHDPCDRGVAHCDHDFGPVFCWKCGTDKPEPPPVSPPAQLDVVLVRRASDGQLHYMPRESMSPGDIEQPAGDAGGEKRMFAVGDTVEIIDFSERHNSKGEVTDVYREVVSVLCGDGQVRGFDVSELMLVMPASPHVPSLAEPLSRGELVLAKVAAALKIAAREASKTEERPYQLANVLHTLADELAKVRR